MKVNISGQYHEQKAFAEQDKKNFIFLFELIHSFGVETVFLTDRKEYRATCSIDTDDYAIKKATPSQK